MKLLAPFFATVGALVLASCATPPRPPSSDSYQAQYERLNAECVAREGILASTGAQSGYPQRDYACRIGTASRIQR
jgi:hypothetical protein